MPEPFVMRDSLLTLGTPGSDFAAELSGATISPQGGSPVTFQGLKPTASFSAGTTPTWQLGLEYAQDWDDEVSLSRYLYEHEGETVSFRLEPITGGTAFTGEVIITPGAIGGAVNAVATASVTLGLKARPSLVAAA
jgi:hypothetical protein